MTAIVAFQAANEIHFLLYYRTGLERFSFKMWTNSRSKIILNFKHIKKKSLVIKNYCFKWTKFENRHSLQPFGNQ